MKQEREFREFDISGSCWREYKIDLEIAKHIRNIFLGEEGFRSHSWRAVAIAITGTEDQMLGKDLVRAASYTLEVDLEELKVNLLSGGK